MRQSFLSGLITPSLFLLLLASCATIADPPEYLSINFVQHPADIAKFSPNGRGFVIGLGYFTHSQMKDARWEFSRVQNILSLQCGGRIKIIRRDVRWHVSASNSNTTCASAAYSLYCMPEEDWGTEYDHIPPEAFDDTVPQILNTLSNPPIQKQCGEKDGYTVWEKRLKKENPSSIPPTLQQIKEKEMERIEKILDMDQSSGKSSNYNKNYDDNIEIRNIVCRPQSLSGFYCKYDLKGGLDSISDAKKWIVRRVVMLKINGVWDQSEY